MPAKIHLNYRKGSVMFTPPQQPHHVTKFDTISWTSNVPNFTVVFPKRGFPPKDTPWGEPKTYVATNGRCDSDPTTSSSSTPFSYDLVFGDDNVDPQIQVDDGGLRKKQVMLCMGGVGLIALGVAMLLAQSYGVPWCKSGGGVQDLER